ncbi:MAG: hypothetical protein KC435_00935 [Thermomicrobiales bacterium]|nr:hypothetical protein [Thermomicrobiales bacterium]
MKVDRSKPVPSRSDAYRRAANYALVATVVLLMLLKFFTAITLFPALLAAMCIFVIVFGFKLRMTPFA